MGRAEASSQASARAGAIPHVIAVTSGKGGAGKTSLSVNLALALARLGRRVCILDADTGFANVNILLGLVPEFSLEHVIYADKTVAEIMLEGPHDLKVIPGARSLVDGVNLEPRQQLHLCRELAAIESEFEYLFVDTAAGFNETAMDFIRASHQTLIVLTPEPTSLTDAFSLVRMLHRRGRRKNLHIVVNMCKSSRQAREVFYRFSGAVEKYIGVRLNYLGSVLRDESLQTAVSMQSPVALFDRDDPSSQSFFRLAEVLGDTLSNVKPKAGFSAWWQAMYRRQHEMAPETAKHVAQTGQQSASTAEPSPDPIADTAGPSPEPEGQRMANALAEPLTTDESRRRELSNLQTRLLTLMAERALPPTEVKQFIATVSDAMREYYPGVESPRETPAVPERVEGSRSHTVTAYAPAPGDDGFVQRYDEACFGSQAELVERIRADQDIPLMELLESLRAGR